MEKMYSLSPNDALRKLIAGNHRFVTASMTHEHQTVERRVDVAKGQEPFAVIVACSDSRAAPEVLFDQGLGDLFVIRSAGNVVAAVGLGSVEYAVDQLGVPLVMVLGHKRCGAVQATVDGGEAPGSIGSVCALIQPAVEKARTQDGDIVDNAVRNNVGNVADRIAASPLLREKIQAGKVKVIRAYYDLDAGTVTLLE